MQQLKLPVYLLLLLLLTACSMLKENTVYEMDNGPYKNKTNGLTQKVWVQFEDTIIRLYTLQQNVAKKNSLQFFSFNEISDKNAVFLNLKKTSFDIDVITIPFKYRPPVKSFPNQLNANFSGAIYTGVRNDFYHFHYKRNAIGENQRKLNHLGISFGFFTGIGSAALTPG